MDDELLALAHRCETADGPDRGIDLAIELFLEGAGYEYAADNWPEDASHYTSSLDAALTLVPEGCILANLTQRTDYDIAEAHRTSVDPTEWRRWSALVHPQTTDKTWRIGQRHLHGGFADAPALALCAAALRARAAA